VACGSLLIERIDEKTLAGLKRKVEARQRLTDQAGVSPRLPLGPWPPAEKNGPDDSTKKATARRSPAAQASLRTDLPRRGRSIQIGNCGQSVARAKISQLMRCAQPSEGIAEVLKHAL
jgi:hypothetical protein